MTPLILDYKNLFASFGLKADQFDILAEYYIRLLKINESINVFSRQMTEKELIENHFVDCAMTLPMLPKFNRLADLGSGGGLPSFIFAIARPQAEVVAYEKSVLKAKFLNTLIDLAPNYSVRSLVPKELDEFDLVTARAFKPIDVILDMTQGYAQTGKQYFLLKGRKEKILEEIKDSEKKFKNFEFKILPIKSPLLEVERHIVFIQKL